MKAPLSARKTASLPIRLMSALFLVSGTAFAGDVLATTYRIVVLPMPTGTQLYGNIGPNLVNMNAAGDVVSTLFSRIAGEPSVVEWSPPDYGMRVLPKAQGSTTFAKAISDAGDILGMEVSQDGSKGNGVIWTSGGLFVRLATKTPGGKGSAYPIDINSHAVVVGKIQIRGDIPIGRPAVWLKPQVIQVLNRPLSADDLATAVNDSDMVVGYAATGEQNSVHAFSWTRGVGVRDLGDLPGGKDYSIANDVNNSNQIVGYGYSDVGQRALLWDADGSMHDLGDLPDTPSDIGYFATRLNNLGEVLGSTFFGAGWLWTAGTGMLPIESLIDPNDPLYGAGSFYFSGISDAGVIAGTLLSPGAAPLPILLVPQP